MEQNFKMALNNGLIITKTSTQQKHHNVWKELTGLFGFLHLLDLTALFLQITVSFLHLWLYKGVPAIEYYLKLVMARIL